MAAHYRRFCEAVQPLAPCWPPAHSRSGLAALDLLSTRISATLADEVEWLSCQEIGERTLTNGGNRADSGRRL